MSDVCYLKSDVCEQRTMNHPWLYVHYTTLIIKNQVKSKKLPIRGLRLGQALCGDKDCHVGLRPPNELRNRIRYDVVCKCCNRMMLA